MAPGRENGFGKAVSRILSASGLRRNGENHLSQQPVPETCFAFAKRGAGRSWVSYLALHPMGFSVPRRSLVERWSLTPPFHPYLGPYKHRGGLFSVALSVGTPHGVAARVYPAIRFLASAFTGYAASRPLVFGLSSPTPLARGRSDSPPFQNRGKCSREAPA